MCFNNCRRNLDLEDIWNPHCRHNCTKEALDADPRMAISWKMANICFFSNNTLHFLTFPSNQMRFSLVKIHLLTIHYYSEYFVFAAHWPPKTAKNPKRSDKAWSSAKNVGTAAKFFPKFSKSNCSWGNSVFSLWTALEKCEGAQSR